MLLKDFSISINYLWKLYIGLDCGVTFLLMLCLQDSVVMERLIEKYMSLPNQAWDNIVKEATRVSYSDSGYSCIQDNLTLN